MPLSPNRALRRAIKDSGYTQTGLAEAVNDVHEAIYGTPGRCDDRYIRRLLRGEIAWPHDATRLPLEAVLGRRAAELGFRSPQFTPGRRTVRIPASPLQDQELPVKRRNFALGIGAFVALPVLPEAGRIGMNDVARVRQAEGHLVKLDADRGGAGLAAVAGRYVEHVERAMRHCSYGSRVQSALYHAVGEMSAQAGWLAYDSQQHQEARGHWRTALQYARLGKTPELEARIWSGMARQAVDLGHGTEAVGIARAALDATRRPRNPRLSALLHTRVALGHAAAGQSGRCGQSLNRAERELDRAPAEAPPWLAFCGHDEVAAQVALCHYELGDHPRAQQAARRAAELTPPEERRRNSFASHVNLARSSLRAGDADEALTAGHRALNLLPDVRSQRWVHQLDLFRREVETRNPAGGADFAERYRMVAA